MRKPKNLLVLEGGIGKVERRHTSYVSTDYSRRRTVLRITGTVLALVVVLMAVWGIVSVFASIMEPEKHKLINVDNAATEFGDDDALDILLIKTDDNGMADKCVLMRFEPSEERVYLTGLSPRTVFGGKTLYDHYAEGGTEQCSSVIAADADCPTVYTIVLNYKQTGPLINDIGTVTVTVPYTINYTSPNNDRNINVAAGTREFTGGEVARLLNYPDWQGGEAEHLSMHSSIVGTLISEQLTPKADEEKIKKLYLTLYSDIAFDMPMSAYHNALNGLLYLAHSNDEGSLSMQVTLETQEQSDGTLSFTEKGRAQLQAIFGRRG